MTKVQTPSEDHEQFDAICAQVDDWEPLPSVLAARREEPGELDEREPGSPLNEMILAGLVSPY